jgi:membrane protease subunit (stomatin/prohibitin family)
METSNRVFLEIMEWMDRTGTEIVHRIPENGSGDIKYGAQLIVRDSQSAVFFYNGKAYDAIGPGRHTLKTSNIPILTRVLSAPWGMTSPLRAEVYFVNMRIFTNLKWGTRDPVAFRDSELGLIRLRAFGVYSLRVIQPVLLINSLIGTQGIFRADEIEEYLSQVIASRLNDLLGSKLDTVFNLPGRYDQLADELSKTLEDDFHKFGLGLSDIYISSITPPVDVQKAIDDKSRLNIFDDLNKLLKMKAAMALEKASESQNEAGATMGVGVGLLMPAMLANLYSGVETKASPRGARCPQCQHVVPRQAVFCPYCGSHLLIFDQCSKCNKNLPPTARFCPRCGQAVEIKPVSKKCEKCGSENLANSVFCNHCGEKLDAMAIDKNDG